MWVKTKIVLKNVIDIDNLVCEMLLTSFTKSDSK